MEYITGQVGFGFRSPYRSRPFCLLQILALLVKIQSSVAGSLKASLCVQGLDMMYAYCDQYKIPYKKVGKLIVAVDEEEVPRLLNLLKNGQANKVRDLQLIEGEYVFYVFVECFCFRFC